MRVKKLKTYLTLHTLRYFVSHPRALRILPFAMRDFFLMNSQIPKEASRAFSLSRKTTQKLISELYEAPFLKESVTPKGLKTIGKEWLYLAVRILRPSIVLETGVSAGCSSAIILLALDKNKYGYLHSIDIAEFTPTGDRVGWLIPKNLRQRWFFYRGESIDILSTLLPKLGRIDIFLHDSDQSYSNMIKEFKMVYHDITPEGLLLADDVGMHNAFSDFCALVGVEPLWQKGGFGVVRKPHL